MSSFAYPNLAAAIAPENMPDPVPVDQVMPPPQTAPEHYLHQLGKLLADKKEGQQGQQGQQQGPQSNNPYSVNNSGNPYAIEGGSPFEPVAQKIRQHWQVAATPSAEQK